MDLDNAREAKAAVLKEALGYEELAALQFAGSPSGGFGYAGDTISERFNEHRKLQLKDYHSRALISVGIERPEGNNGASLVIFCQSRRAYDSDRVDRALRAAKGEARKVFVGPIRRLAPRSSPRIVAAERETLRIGSSIGHPRVTAGTLGCFVDRGQGGGICILSNNHILANVNAARMHDPILSPGRVDGGRDPENRCGSLNNFVPINLDGVTPNRVDCATAAISRDYECDPATLSDPHSGRRFGTLQKSVPTGDILGMPVRKIGRTTGLTSGEVVAIEVDGIRVMMDSQGYARTALFNSQIVVASRDGRFCKGGDSGSVVFGPEGEPVGLLFAGADRPYGEGFEAPTYANPLDVVLDALDCDIFTG